MSEEKVLTKEIAEQHLDKGFLGLGEFSTLEDEAAEWLSDWGRCLLHPFLHHSLRSPYLKCIAGFVTLCGGNA